MHASVQNLYPTLRIVLAGYDLARRDPGGTGSRARAHMHMMSLMNVHDEAGRGFGWWAGNKIGIVGMRGR